MTDMKKSIFIVVCAALGIMTSCDKKIDVTNAKSLSELTEADVSVSRIDPTDWYVGLKDPSLQLMVYGQGIREAEVSVQGAKIDSLVKLDSPDYLFVYLNIKNAHAGILPLTFQLGDKETTIAYQLKEREMDGDDRQGFTNEDVLYMLMPDRFAQGENHPSQVEGMQHYVEDRSEPSLRHGGDLEGIRQHLDYFTDLGVNHKAVTPRAVK